MNSERIKLLKNIIKKNGFTYELIQRNDTKCIYAQKFNDVIIAYEVFKTKLSNPHPKSLDDVQNYDKVETFPRDEEFGKRAWTYPTIEKAMLSFETK